LLDDALDELGVGQAGAAGGLGDVVFDAEGRVGVGFQEDDVGFRTVLNPAP
jgi:hypothetical protein